MRTLVLQRPRSLHEALELKREREGSCWLAGGTDLLVKVKERVARPTSLVSLRRVPGLTGIRVDDDDRTVRIGAITPVADVAAHQAVRERYPVLARALSLLGTPQVRNQATIGGNLCNCSPCADSAPPLIVLGAQLRVDGPHGSREETVADFALGPGRTSLSSDELLTQVLLPPSPPGARTAFLKKRRTAVDLALASVAVLLCLDADGRVATIRAAAGSVAPVPFRLRAAEAVIGGQAPTPDVLAAAAEAASAEIAPISDLRASADYRRHVTGVLLKRAVSAVVEGRPA